MKLQHVILNPQDIPDDKIFGGKARMYKCQILYSEINELDNTITLYLEIIKEKE